MKKRRILRSERGFTLVELGIVMAIIAILAAVAYPTYTGIKKRAYIAEAKATLQEVRVEAYAVYVDKGSWPASTGELTVTDTAEWDIEIVGVVAAAGSPVDPEHYEIKATGKGKVPATNIVTLKLYADGTAKFVEVTP